MTDSVSRVLRNFERMAVIRLVTRSARALNSIQTTQQTNKRVSTAMNLKKEKKKKNSRIKVFQHQWIENKTKQNKKKNLEGFRMKKKKIRKGKFSLNLRAQWDASKEYFLEYLWETSVSALRPAKYYNESKYKSYLIERSEIRPIRTACNSSIAKLSRT